MFGYLPTEIDDQPAARLDWLLACHAIATKVRNDREKAAHG